MPSLRDKMKGKDTEDIITQLKDKSPEYKLEKAIEYNLYELAKIAIEEGIGVNSNVHENIMGNLANIDNIIINLILKEELIIHPIIVVIKMRMARYDFAKYLRKYGFSINPKKYSNITPSFLGWMGSFSIDDFIQKHREFLAKKHNVSEYSIKDNMWDDSISIIKSNLIKILGDYGLSLKEPLLYGYGDLMVKLEKPKVTEKDKEIMDILKEQGVDPNEELYEIIMDNLK